MSKPLASIGQRFTAQFLDDLVALTIGVAVYLVASFLALPLELAILGFFLYLLLCDGLPGGQSLGKRMTKTSVVHVATGQPCSYLQSCARNFAMVLGVVDAVLIVGQQRRRLGDYIGRTKVVRLDSFK
jgi:uncharacterized RDD family membrane protein YckC